MGDKRKSLVYISYSAAPHQIKLCEAMQEFYDAEFWFYSRLGNRAEFWKYPLGEYCKVLNKVFFNKGSKFLTFQHLRWLQKARPDIVMLGGFSVPANYLAYLWARFNGKKTIVFTERSRDKDGNLRKRNFTWSLIRFLYRNVDIVMTSEEDIVEQFRDEFGFGDKVYASRYSADIENYLNHPIRQGKSSYVYLFPNRLTEIYNPLEAIEIFREVQVKYPGSTLIMNALGELRDDCEQLINSYKLSESVEFLDNIQSWNELHKEYLRSDIMIFPAKFSNGNFTIIEAMASGMGIIITNKVLGVGSYIENGVNGFNLNLDREEFLKAINEFVEKPELFKIFAKENKKRIGHLGPKGTAELYHSIIRQLY